MSIDHLRPKTITGIKSLAKALKKRDGLTHSDALDRASVRAGFTDYRHALTSLPVFEADPRSPAKPALRLRT